MVKRIPHRWINWRQIVLDDIELPFHSKALALFLSTYMNDSNDMAYPSVSTIRGRMGIGSNSTVIKYLAILEDNGYLVTEKRYGNSKIYTAVIPPDHPSITPPVVLHEVDDSITRGVITVLHDVEPNSQENSQENSQGISPAGAGSSKPKVSPCPYQAIVDLYHETLPMLPPVIKISEKRKSHMRARWNGDAGDLDFWRDYFETVATSKFLTGRAQPTQGRPVFRADIDFLIREDVMIKTQEGKYHAEV